MTSYTLPVLDTVKAAWKKVKGSKKTFWQVFGIVILIQLISVGLDQINQSISIWSIILIIFLISLILSIIRIILLWGAIYIGERRAADHPIQVSLIKHVFDFLFFLKMIGLYILQCLILLPAIILLLIPSFLEGDAEKFIGPILYVIGAILLIYLGIRLYLGKIIVITQKINPWKAIKLSFKGTKHNVWRLIGLTIINTIILIISVIPLGIGLIWSLPYLFINYGEVYKRLITSRNDLKGQD